MKHEMNKPLTKWNRFSSRDLTIFAKNGKLYTKDHLWESLRFLVALNLPNAMSLPLSQKEYQNLARPYKIKRT